jgi:hypothetical protein
MQGRAAGFIPAVSGELVMWYQEEVATCIGTNAATLVSRVAQVHRREGMHPTPPE